MQDIALWNMLAEAPVADGDGGSERLRALLEELAALPLAERWPFFGRLATALAHKTPSVRAAALKVLGGAGGVIAFRAIVHALDDRNAAVRHAAVAALGVSSASDGARWAHAAFHPLPDVRSAALAHPPGRQLPWYAMLLLADETCRDAVAALLMSSIPPQNVFTVLDFVRRGLMPRETAAEAVASMPIEELYRVLSRAGPWRSDDAVRALIDAGTGADRRASAVLAILRADPTADVLDELLGLFWSDQPRTPQPAGARQPARDRFYERLISWAIDRSRRNEADRVLCAVLVSAARAGSWDPLAAETALLLQPQFLDFRWVDPAVRRAAVEALYRHASRLDPLSLDLTERLLRAQLSRRTDGRLDLWLIGGILRWSGGDVYQLAERVLGLGSIVEAFLAEPADSAPFFAIPKDPKGRKRILDEIASRSRHSTGAIFSGLILVSDADELSFLDELDGRDALGVYRSLLAMTTGPSGATLSDNKVRRLAELLSPKLLADHVEDVLRATVDTPGAEWDALALRLLSTLARDAGAARMVAIVRRLEPDRLNRLLGIIPSCAGFPYGVEKLLAESLNTHKDAAVRAWCAGRVATGAAVAGPPDRASDVPVVRLSEAVRKQIATCATVDLAAAVAPCLKAPTSGLAAALAARNPPGMLSIATCVALLGCHDPPDDVAEQFATFSADEPEFLRKLEAAAVAQWAWNQHLPLLGNCWLHLWDPHCFAAGAVLVGWTGGLVGALRWALSLRSVVLCRQVFDTVARLLAMWHRREKAKLAALDLPALCAFLVDALPGDMGLPAAKALATVHESRLAVEVMDALQPRVSAMLPELPEPERNALQAWVDARGLAAAAVRRAATPADPEVLRRIARCRDLDQLEAFCRGESNQEVQEATLRLIELGEMGLARLVDLLTESQPQPPLAVVIAESIPLWPEGDSLAALRKWLLDATGSSEVLMTVGIGLLERGDGSVVEALMALCRRPSDVKWFRQAHWDRLIALGVPAVELSIGLAASPHPYAYQNALAELLWLKREHVDDRVINAVAAFLESDSQRRRELRLRAADWLRHRGNHCGLPLLLQEAVAAKTDDHAKAAGFDRDTLLEGAPADLVEQATLAVLHAGPQVTSEERLLELLGRSGVDETARDDALASLVKDASLARTRAQVVSRMRTGTSRAGKLRRLAQTFAWGVITGREITGRIFAVEMNAGEGLGHTRLETDKVWITPLPILRGERHAEAVTRGLIVHEFGHHMYHRTPEALAVWDEATKEGYHGLLNLVSDEHLERNLRALDEDLGDDLKKLAAYAFQHADKEVPLDALLASLQSRAFDVLTASDLRVARRRGCVLVNNGKLLAEMERAGMSFSRFVRALRMGLGKRSADEKVTAGLELFKRAKFRKSTMPELKDLTLRLRDIFGWEAVLMESFAQDALLSPDAADVMANAEGITGDELREAVRRLLEDRTRRGGRKDDRSGGVKVLNVGPEESFQPITTVVPVPYDPAQHAAYAAQVAGPARQMRRYLSQLGLRMEEQRYRVQGRRVDRARLVPAGMLRGDPRLLIARRVRIEADLFLGLIIDCSGSMQMSDHMNKAKLYATLLAEAAKGLDGIDVRVFGFTDSVIYDAGDARHCAAHGLEAEGGNNDAAALWHGALAARASRRRAKLLVMISDGSPTECTTNALRALVSRVSNRMNICCAQLAVCSLDVKCFPHYVELLEENVGDSVRRFGAVVMRLVQKAMRAS